MSTKSAVFINATVALVLALRNATTLDFRQTMDTFGNGRVTSLVPPFLLMRIFFSLAYVILIHSQKRLSLTGTRFSSQLTANQFDD